MSNWDDGPPWWYLIGLAALYAVALVVALLIEAPWSP